MSISISKTQILLPKGLVTLGLLLMISTTLSSCLKIHAVKAKRGRNYESFLKPGGQMQYFIFPLEFKNKEETVTIDFTLRSEFTSDSLVAVNFSVYTDKEFSSLMQATLHHADGTSELMHIKKLFSEPSGNARHYRFTSNLYFADILPLFSNPERTSIGITQDNGAFVVNATVKTQKILRQLKEQITLLQGNKG